MNFRLQTSPYLRDPRVSVPKMMINVVIALVPVVLFATFTYGFDYILTLIAALISICGTEYISNRVMKRTTSFKELGSLTDMSAVVTSIIFSLIITLYTPMWVIIISGAIATVFSKMIFGGMGQNLFNPAAIARIFILISFTSLVSSFADASTSATALGILGESDSLSEGFASVTSQIDLKTTLLGGHYGTYGETSPIPILIGGAWLLFSKAADYRIMITSIVAFTLMNIVVMFNNDLDATFVIYQLCSGGFLFGAVYMMTDPVTAPTYGNARVFVGLLFAAVVFVIRYMGATPEGVLYAILICNMFSPLLDHYKFVSSKLNRGWKITFVITAIALFAIALLV